MTLYIWQYFLVVPVASLAAASAAAPSLNNPDGISSTFRRYPLPNVDGEYLLPATYWAATFLASDTINDGNPSREALEGYLGQHPELEALLWVRIKNPHHIGTPEIDLHKVVASNWPAFPQGATCDWVSISQALA